jgi:acyl carrier protein
MRRIPIKETEMLDAQAIRSTVDTIILEVMEMSGAAKSVGGGVPASVEPQMDLSRDFGLDSLDILELVSALETRFGIEMPDDVFEAVSTVGDLHRYMSTTLSQRAA